MKAANRYTLPKTAMVIYKKYLSIYRVIDDTVYVYHIADGRTNYPQILKTEN